MASKQLRPIRVEGNVAYIPLTKGYEAIIDAEDMPLVEGRNWFADVVRRSDQTVSIVYAKSSGPRQNGRQTGIRLHRLIAGGDASIDVDHRDGDGLNCRRKNLRPATHQQNTLNRRTYRNNTSGVKGVTWDRAAKKWRAQIYMGNRHHSLGRFNRIEDAAAAYAEASARLHGDFGRCA